MTVSSRYVFRVLRQRREFLAVAACARKCGTLGLVLQISPRAQAVAGVGFTASRKVGGAVARNRAKRRLRALVRGVLAAHASHDFDYVLIAKEGTLTRGWDALCGDLRYALRKLGAMA